MTKVLITGITGFLGPYIAREMLEHGYQVIGISRHKPQEEIKGVFYLQGSVDDFNFINTAMEKTDFVIHSAAKSTIWGDYWDFYNVNVLGTKNIIEACEFHQIKRLVYVSSPSIYSKFVHQYSVKEDDLLGESLNHYIETKKLAEEQVGLSKVPYNIIRPRALIGVGDTSIVPRLFQAEKKLGIPLFNKGQNMVSVTCVENVAYAIRLMCESEIVGETFNITDGVDWKFKDLLDSFYDGRTYKTLRAGGWMKYVSICSEWISKVLKKEPLLTKYVYSTLAYSQTLDITKAEKLLGYAPNKVLKDRMDKYRDFYFKN